MTMAPRNRRILDEMSETIRGLQGAGLVSKRRMSEFEVFGNLAVRDISSGQIKALREKAHVSQAVFAAVLNISVSTVQKWECGDKKPNGPSLKLLNLIERKGFEVVL